MAAPALMQATSTSSSAASGGHRVLRMVQCDRMAGSVPCWDYVSYADEAKNAAAASAAQQPAAGDAASNTPKNIAASPSVSTTPKQEKYGFKDILDVINPLQHIPIVDHIYRSLTGDTIKPSGEVLGGALYGGPLGAASGLFNVIFEHETGKDMMANATQLITRGKMPQWRSSAAPSQVANNVSAPSVNQAPAKIASASSVTDLPGALLAFADLKQGGVSSGDQYADAALTSASWKLND